MKSPHRSAQVEWARCIARATRGSIARWRSRFFQTRLAADPQFRERFDREARVISQLTHPHICTLYDVGDQDGTAFLVMEFLEGETLADRLGRVSKTSGPGLPLGETLQIAIQIAEALDKAHRAGVVHRDLKPGNIMLTRTGSGAKGAIHAKLLDFGLAKAGASPALAGASMLATTPPNLTAQGTILGTFHYMAPEQLEGGEADARTDIFAFGLIVYEMVTGRKVFEGKSQAALIAAILERQPAPMASSERPVPHALESIVQGCLAKDPDDRWQTARDVVRQLKGVASTDAAGDRGAIVDRRRREGDPLPKGDSISTVRTDVGGAESARPSQAGIG